MSQRLPSILFILHYPPPVHGASMMGEYIRTSKKINSSFECHFVNLSTSQELNEIGKGGLNKFKVLIRLYLRIISRIFSRRYDYCYMTINSKGSGYYKEMVIVLILKMLNYKLIYHYHNKGVESSSNNFFLNKLYRIQLHKARVILLSENLYSDISKYLPRDRVYICPNGIPVHSGSDPERLKKLRASCELPCLLFLSNMMKEKGVFNLLEACRLLRNEGILFRTSFAGSWSDIGESDFYSYIRSHNLDEVVIYEGRKDGDEKAACFEKADIFVLPTLNDAFPLVNLEAIQYGIPVITTDEGGIPDVIQNDVNGFLVPKDDPGALAEKIRILIEDPALRARMGENGRRLFEKYYTLERFEDNFIGSIESIIKDFSVDRL